MKYLLIIFGVLNSILCFSQINNTLLKPQNLIHVKKDSVILLADDNNIFLKGQKFSIDSKLLNIQIDTIYDNLILFSRFKNSNGYKEVICYNLDSDSVLWRYRTLCQSCRLIKDNIALIYTESSTSNNKVFLLDRITGKPKGFIENGNMFSVSDLNLLFYIFPKHGFFNELEIVDGKTDLLANKIRIPSDYFFSSYSIDDSCLYLNINGIYAFDGNYKKLWDFGLSTMQMDLKSVLLSASFGLGIGMLTGFTPIYYAPNYLANLNSDFYFHKGNLIISDKENIYSFVKKTGEEVWHQRLPFRTGYSHLMNINDSITSLLNTGLCIKNGRIHSYSAPYCSWFNSDNGLITNSQVFAESEFISDFRLNNDTLLILLNNGIYKVKGQDILAKKIFTIQDSVGTFQLLYPNSLNLVFIIDSTQLKWLHPDSLKKSKNDLAIITTKGMIIIEEDFKLSRYIPTDRIGKLLYENTNYQLFETINNYKNDYVISNGIVKYDKLNGTSINFNINYPYMIDKERLYFIRQDSIEVYSLE